MNMEPKISDLLIAVSKAESRIAALEDVVRELVANGKAAIKETDYPVTHIQMQWDDSCDKDFELLNQNGGK